MALNMERNVQRFVLLLCCIKKTFFCLSLVSQWGGGGGGNVTTLSFVHIKPPLSIIGFEASLDFFGCSNDQ